MKTIKYFLKLLFEYRMRIHEMKIAFIQRKAEIEIQMKKELMQLQSQIKIQEMREKEGREEICRSSDGTGICEDINGNEGSCLTCFGKGKHKWK